MRAIEDALELSAHQRLAAFQALCDDVKSWRQAIRDRIRRCNGTARP
jgi:hypothetical protein